MWGALNSWTGALVPRVAETDASGNPIHAFRVPLVTYGKSRHQAEALIGDAVARVVAYARETGKPVVIERLDFRQKKAALEGESRRYSRMLSSFSYGKVKAFFLSCGYRQGVEVQQVNPAFSSVMGRVKFMERYGLSVHQAAALVLARRLLGCSERIPRRWVAPVGKGVQVAFSVPARTRVKHVWTYWSAVSGQLGPALAAQHRLGRWRGPPIRFRLPGGWLEQGSARCSLVGSGAEPPCTVGTAARRGPRLGEWPTAVCYQRQPFLQWLSLVLIQLDSHERRTSHRSFIN